MDLKSLTDDELEQHSQAVLQEQERRQQLVNIPKQIHQLRDQYEAAGGDPNSI